MAHPCTRESLRLVRAGTTLCIRDRTYGCAADGHNMWVSGGCWGHFKVPGAIKFMTCGHRMLQRIRNPSGHRVNCSILWPSSVAMPAEIAKLARDLLCPSSSDCVEAYADVLRAEYAILSLHGQVLRMHATRGDYMLPRLAREFSGVQRYRLASLQGDGNGASAGAVVVDVGCNLGDFSIAAWRSNPSLHILCLEPMPATFLFLRWNLQANGVPLLTPSTFGMAGAKGGVLAMRAAATADGRTVPILYHPRMSGFGVTSASSEDGRLRADFHVPRTRADEDAAASSWRSSAPSLDLSAWLGARDVRSLRFLKMDCEGCEHEVLPAIRPLLRKTRMFEGEIHPCSLKQNLTCRYSNKRLRQTVQSLCSTGHVCRQCNCTSKDLVAGAG